MQIVPKGDSMTADRFPAALPPFPVAFRQAKDCAVPSDFAALSATCILSGIVAGRRNRLAEAVAFRALATALSAHCAPAAGA